MKRTSTPTSSTDPTKVRKTVSAPRPSIVGTKASQARAKAIKSAQLSSNASNVSTKRKRPQPPPLQEPSLAKSYHTTASGLKQRPAWDLRVTNGSRLQGGRN
jgi:hypothetical protein